MKKCGILTINVSLMNYGNRLQNYALQCALGKLDCDVATVNYKPTYPASSYEGAKSSNENERKDKIRDTVSLIKRRSLFVRNRLANKDKRRKFDKFIHQYICWTEHEYGIESDFSPLDREFDFLVAGSDQVWNPYWEGTQPIYFMQFVSESKRIAYAASFGVSSVPEELEEQYKIYMDGIPNVSCREDAGCDLVQKLTGKRPVQVLDPVFLLDRKEWERIEEKPKGIGTGKPYILVYFLGDITKENEEKIKQLQKEMGCWAIYLDRKDKINACFASPTEFLYLVHHARVVCTDSFHGSAFSIIYNKPLVCFQRSLNKGSTQDMSSRLTSLFNLFACNRYDSVLSVSEMGEMEYQKINRILAREKEKSIAYLSHALEVEK